MHATVQLKLFEDILGNGFFGDRRAVHEQREDTRIVLHILDRSLHLASNGIIREELD